MSLDERTKYKSLIEVERRTSSILLNYWEVSLVFSINAVVLFVSILLNCKNFLIS